MHKLLKLQGFRRLPWVKQDLSKLGKLMKMKNMMIYVKSLATQLTCKFVGQNIAMVWKAVHSKLHKPLNNLVEMARATYKVGEIISKIEEMQKEEQY